MRTKKIENDVNCLNAEAMEKKKNIDDRGAIAALRKQKWWERISRTRRLKHNAWMTIYDVVIRLIWLVSILRDENIFIRSD